MPTPEQIKTSVERLRKCAEQGEGTDDIHYAWAIPADIKTILTALSEAQKDKERLDGLLNLTDNEGEDGWQIVLRYDNYQDCAMVIDADANIIGECGDINLDANAQFRVAIDQAALHNEKGKE